MRTSETAANFGPTYLNRYCTPPAASTLLFMHLTKTAGGTLKESFRSAVPADQIEFYYPAEPGFTSPSAYDPNLAVIFGHFIFGIHERVSPDARYACILRDPVSRHLSHYFHLRNFDHSRVGNAARDSNSFVDYIHKHKRWEFDNFYVRLLSGVAEKVPFGKIGEPELRSALDNLRNRFVFVGLFDAFPDVVAALGRYMSRELVIGETINQGRGGVISIDDKLLAAKISAYDLALYRAARDIFDWDGTALHGSRDAARSPAGQQR